MVYEHAEATEVEGLGETEPGELDKLRANHMSKE